MRYGLISDIHGNLEAFQASLEALSKLNIDKYLCIGDIVGYGADPKACIALVKSLEPVALVSGNHEWGVLGLLDLEYFNEYAKEAILWTKVALDKGDSDYLLSFRLIYKDDGMTLVHGTLDHPEDFNYTLDINDAYISMKLMKTSLCFVGHSHVPGIFYSEGDGIKANAAPEVKIEEDRKYVVNIGSIGQPRDGDPRASYAVFDDEKKTVEIRRVAYDIKKAQEKILKAGLPGRLASRLSLGE
ncbi:MAG: metallophosphoesterase family protein [Candidatus Omnitrophica bacterium]|nr:metallophosphoesterase family protein [Candidatus Omnitrophota bacterium]